MQQHTNKKHCIVGQIHEGRRGNALGTQQHKGTNIFRYKKKKVALFKLRGLYDKDNGMAQFLLGSETVQISSHHGFIKPNEDMVRKQSHLLLPPQLPGGSGSVRRF